MSRIHNDKFIIEEEPKGICEFCKETHELRPYGPNGENICLNCAMKDPQTTQRKFEERLNAAGVKMVIL